MCWLGMIVEFVEFGFAGLTVVFTPKTISHESTKSKKYTKVPARAPNPRLKLALVKRPNLTLKEFE